MCGVIGIIAADRRQNVAAELLDGAMFLQHRGQDAAGITTCGEGGRIYQCKGNGMARDVFTAPRMAGLLGSMGIAHLRYPTAGSSANSEAQPFYVNSPYGIALSHNGNLVNASALRDFLDQSAHRHINTGSDSEVLLNVFAALLEKNNKRRVAAEDIFSALRGTMEMCRGAYACVVMLAGYGILGFRDPHGIRPLVLGERKHPDGSVDYMMASESVVLVAHGFSNFRDILPGEAVIIPKDTQTPVSRQLVPMQSYTPDIFEYVYFARPDSVMDGISVYRARLSMGTKLADKIMRGFGSLEALKKAVDVVIPVPDTSRHAALQLAVKLQLPYREGFVKNRYVGRTFIMPNQTERKSSVRRKLNAMELEFSGRNVLLVDDSIVRGTTSREIIQMAREAGAAKVYFASCAPPIRHNHIYGIDLADTKALVAYGKDEEQIGAELGADAVYYQSLDDLVEACSYGDVSQFEVGVFTGGYVTGAEDNYIDELEKERAINQRLRENGNAGIAAQDWKAEVDIGVYNSGDYKE